MKKISVMGLEPHLIAKDSYLHHQKSYFCDYCKNEIKLTYKLEKILEEQSCKKSCSSCVKKSDSSLGFIDIAKPDFKPTKVIQSWLKNV